MHAPTDRFYSYASKPGEKTAKAYLALGGWTASISGNIFGFTAPFESEDMSWNFNPMGGSVACYSRVGLLRLYAR